MQRYFINADQFTDHRVTITGDDAHHIQKVMRMKPADLILCANNKGAVYLCAIESFAEGSVHALIKSRQCVDSELPIHVTIAQGIPKGDKFETIIQKGTECGARCFVPFQADRCVALWKKNKADKKRLRLEKISKEAVEQSHRRFIPEISEPMNLDQLIAFSASFPFKVVAFEETAKAGQQARFPTVLKEMTAGDSLLAVVGPEGGLTAEEADTLKNHGFVLCGLGPRILRTETAALYLLSAISYHFELLQYGVDE